MTVPADQTARDRIAGDLGTTLFVEAGAGVGKTTALVARLTALVEAGIPIESIAAITFTERAAAELRHRVRDELTRRVLDADADRDVTARRQAALDRLDAAPIGTIHAFCRRVLTEFPIEAGVPPGFNVLDELSGEAEFDERWADFTDGFLDDPAVEIGPGMPSADFVRLLNWTKFGRLDGLRHIAREFQANWDLVDERVDPSPPPPPPASLLTDVLDRLRHVIGLPTPDGDPKTRERQREYVELLAAVEASDRIDALPMLEKLAETKTSRLGAKANWKKSPLGEHGLDDFRADVAAAAEAAATLQQRWRDYRQALVGAVLALFTTAGAEQRTRSGLLSFHDLLVLTRRLLAHDEAARTFLHERYVRVLLDESQDTDPVQFEIACRLTADPSDQDVGRCGPPRPGRLFVVGDPKQSIYRFRRADISVYLSAPDRIAAERATLNVNFRSTSTVLDWVNGVFGSLITPAPGVQPEYQPLDAGRRQITGHGSVRFVGVTEHPDDVRADGLRTLESESVARAVATALTEGWLVAERGPEPDSPVTSAPGDPTLDLPIEAPAPAPDTDADAGSSRPLRLRRCRPSDITILLPTRMSLPHLEVALNALDVPFRAENAAAVYVSPEGRDLLATLRALVDPSDQLALVVALRSSLFGCSDVDLYDWRHAGGRWSYARPAIDAVADADSFAVGRALRSFSRFALAGRTMSPAEVLSTIVDDRRLLEAALAEPDGRDIWRRVRYLIDQARAWTDSGGRGLRRYLEWAMSQAAEARSSEAILPERDHDSVRIMTIHAAKGLQFPITVLAGLTTTVQRRRTTSVVWPTDGRWALAERGSEIFEDYKPLDEQMSDAERRRLLYVACTRAEDHLVVSLHRTPRAKDGRPENVTAATLLFDHGAAEHGAVELDERSEPIDAVPPDQPELEWADNAAWADERRRTLDHAATRSATSATRVAGQLGPAWPGGSIDNAAERMPEPEPPQLQLDLWGTTSDTLVDEASAPEPTVVFDDLIDEGLDKEPVNLDLPAWQRGRYGTAIGRAVHAVLQDADLIGGADIDDLADRHAAAEEAGTYRDTVAALARSALAAPIVRSTATSEHWRELFVVSAIGSTVVEGYIDLLVRTDRGLVIVDYKTDRYHGDLDERTRLGRYRLQLATYGVAVARLLDEPVVGGVLVHCQVDGSAVQIEVPEWDEACRTVREADLFAV